MLSLLLGSRRRYFPVLMSVSYSNLVNAYIAGAYGRAPTAYYRRKLIIQPLSRVPRGAEVAKRREMLRASSKQKPLVKEILATSSVLSVLEISVSTNQPRNKCFLALRSEHSPGRSRINLTEGLRPTLGLCTSELTGLSGRMFPYLPLAFDGWVVSNHAWTYEC